MGRFLRGSLRLFRVGLYLFSRCRGDILFKSFLRLGLCVGERGALNLRNNRLRGGGVLLGRYGRLGGFTAR